MDNQLAWVLVILFIIVLVSGCSAAPVGNSTVYGYAWAEQEQLDLHEQCMNIILKEAPRDVTLIQLNKWLYECKRDNGNTAF